PGSAGGRRAVSCRGLGRRAGRRSAAPAGEITASVERGQDPCKRSCLRCVWDFSACLAFFSRRFSSTLRPGFFFFAATSTSFSLTTGARWRAPPPADQRETGGAPRRRALHE